MKFNRLLLSLLSLIAAASYAGQDIKIVCTDLSDFPEKYLVTNPCNIDVKTFTRANCLPIKLEITNSSDKEIVVDPILNQHLIKTDQICTGFRNYLRLATYDMNIMSIIKQTAKLTLLATTAINGPMVIALITGKEHFLFLYGLTVPVVGLHAYRFHKRSKERQDLHANSFAENIKALNILDMPPLKPGETVTRIAFTPPLYEQPILSLYFKKYPNKIVYLDCPFREISSQEDR